MTIEREKELSVFVNNHVHVNQSMLVERLLQSDIPLSLGYDYENVTNLFDPEEEASDDQEPQEIFEWWIVSDWLLNQLEKRGEPVLKTDYQDYWGRTTTGQAVAMDSVIEDIYQSI